jgi:hypothetical protein
MSPAATNSSLYATGCARDDRGGRSQPQTTEVQNNTQACSAPLAPFMVTDYFRFVRSHCLLRADSIAWRHTPLRRTSIREPRNPQVRVMPTLCRLATAVLNPTERCEVAKPM